MTAADHDALDLDWITPQLAVGGRYPISAAGHLARTLGVRCVVDLRVETCDDAQALRKHGIELLHLPTHDTCAVSLDMLHDGVAWVNDKLDRGLKVYVHCEHGIGRSALLALCVLVSRGETPLGALARAKASRQKVSPSPEQLQAFRSWLSARRSAVSEDIVVPTFDELAAIAYSHLWRRADAGAAAR